MLRERNQRKKKFRWGTSKLATLHRMAKQYCLCSLAKQNETCGDLSTTPNSTEEESKAKDQISSLSLNQAVSLVTPIDGDTIHEIAYQFGCLTQTSNRLGIFAFVPTESIYPPPVIYPYPSEEPVTSGGIMQDLPKSLSTPKPIEKLNVRTEGNSTGETTLTHCGESYQKCMEYLEVFTKKPERQSKIGAPYIDKNITREELILAIAESIRSRLKGITKGCISGTKERRDTVRLKAFRMAKDVIRKCLFNTEPRCRYKSGTSKKYSRSFFCGFQSFMKLMSESGLRKCLSEFKKKYKQEGWWISNTMGFEPHSLEPGSNKLFPKEFFEFISLGFSKKKVENLIMNFDSAQNCLNSTEITEFSPSNCLVRNDAAEIAEVVRTTIKLKNSQSKKNIIKLVEKNKMLLEAFKIIMLLSSIDSSSNGYSISESSKDGDNMIREVREVIQELIEIGDSSHSHKPCPL
ncbi:unnamed protein product [Moneuplotes crassus]|uniref:Uncharacterized protein n=1 Tax=Euplotes crassus TaxID=5936 RepID=A0AAD1U6Z9_EUPCR|nr:unnamed protein product [Moneuplotes crassus]